MSESKGLVDHAAPEERMPPKRRLRAEVRRGRIADVAMELFAEKGYTGVSLEDIAQVVGVSRPVIYDHFASKQELHLWLLERERDRILERVAPQLVAEVSAEARVFRAFDAFFAYVEHHPYAWRMLFRESAGDAGTVETHRRIQSEANTALVGLLAHELTASLADGADGRDSRLAMLGELGGSAINGLARWWYDHREVPRSELVAVAMDTLWIGLDRLQRGEHWSSGDID